MLCVLLQKHPDPSDPSSVPADPLFEDDTDILRHGVSASLNTMTGRLQVHYPGGSGQARGRDYDRDLRQLSHYLDPSSLEAAKTTPNETAVDRDVDWKKVREEQKAKKQRQKIAELCKD